MQAVFEMAVGTAAVGHPTRGHVAHAAVEGIGVGARDRPGSGVGVVAVAILAVVAHATGLAVHLVQEIGRRGKITIGGVTCGVK